MYTGNRGSFVETIYVPAGDFYTREIYSSNWNTHKDKLFAGGILLDGGNSTLTDVRYYDSNSIYNIIAYGTVTQGSYYGSVYNNGSSKTVPFSSVYYGGMYIGVAKMNNNVETLSKITNWNSFMTRNRSENRVSFSTMYKIPSVLSVTRSFNSILDGMTTGTKTSTYNILYG